MDNITKLKTFADSTNEETITVLREHLAQAERGEIVAVAICALERSGACQTRATATDNFQGMLGALSLLTYRMMAERGHK